MKRIYLRLRRGPLWLGDWKSTGIKSRATVHRALKFSLANGLVSKKRCGHKILYEFIPDENYGSTVLDEFISSENNESKILDWWPFLTTEKDREREDIDHRKHLKSWAFPILEGIKKRIDDTIVYAIRKSQNETITDELSFGYDEIIKAIDQFLGNIDDTKNLDVLNKILEYRLCPECLVKNGVLGETELDRESGEMVCTTCGLVIIVDAKTRSFY